MEFDYDQHILKATNCIPPQNCQDLANFFYALSNEGLTMSSSRDGEAGGQGSGMEGKLRSDEVIHLPAGLENVVGTTIGSQLLPRSKINTIWPFMMDALADYTRVYNMEDTPLDSENWKIHRALPKQGYHIWHHERGTGGSGDRVLVWMVVLEAPEEGGETEFLHQSKRINPEVGNLLIWPAMFTHKHRGNPPLKGHKLYATGWFVSV